MSVVKEFNYDFDSRKLGYFRIDLYAPDIVLWADKENEFEEISRNIRLDFSNLFSFTIDENCWTLNIKFLGFGFGCIRQWGY